MQYITDVIAAISEVSPIEKPLFHFFHQSVFDGVSGYVDGGNACIIQTPWYSVQIIRGACCVLQGARLSSFTRWEFFIVAKRGENGCTITTFGAPAFFQCPSALNHSCADAGNQVRECFEQAIVTWAGKLPLSFLVKDGLLNKLVSQIPLLGLAKTTEQADVCLAQQPGMWWTEHHGNFCRLHSNGYTIFRYEGDTALLPKLAFTARDLVFPGYPYGLMLVDKFARVSHDEVDYLSSLFECLAGKSWSYIVAGMRLLNAHSVLDSVK